MKRHVVKRNAFIEGAIIPGAMEEDVVFLADAEAAVEAVEGERDAWKGQVEFYEKDLKRIRETTQAAVEQARREGEESGIRAGIKAANELAETEVRADERERIVRELRENYSVNAANWVEKYMDEVAPEPKRLERLDLEDTDNMVRIVHAVNALIDAENERRGTR